MYEVGGEDHYDDGDYDDDDDDDEGGGLQGGGAGDEEKVLAELTDILGEENLHYWSLIDQLLFCLEVGGGK
jgi:hypothetical protein